MAGDIELPALTLAQRVRAKYPAAYDDLSDQDLEAKVKAKYPGVYDDLPTTKAGASTAAPPTQPEPPDPDRPVTLGDFLANRGEAWSRVKHLIGNDLTDPKTWLAVAAAYAAPKMVEGASAMRGPVSRAATSLGTTFDEPGMGVLRPGAKMLKTAGKIIAPPPGPTPFHELPLAKQMEQLPADRPAPLTTRVGEPPVRVPLHPTADQALAIATNLKETPLTDWETQFVDSIAERTKAGRDISVKQAATLRRIAQASINVKNAAGRAAVGKAIERLDAAEIP